MICAVLRSRACVSRAGHRDAALCRSGRGVYIWGENEPYYADANAVAGALFGARCSLLAVDASLRVRWGRVSHRRFRCF